MFRKNAIKKSVIVLVALLMCTVFVFTACNKSNAFKPLTAPSGQQVEGNGGIAVRYGDYIYYVNGYQSSNTMNNSYSSEIRVGAIVRIKIADLESIIRINTEDSEKIKEKITRTVAEKAEVVVPNYYFSGHTTDTSLNGIYVFNDRIYITTPNDQLDASGNLLSSQLVLASYDLGGGNVQRHFVFESNAPQLKLSQIGNDVYATYVLNSKLCMFKLTDKLATATEIATEITAQKFTSQLDENGNVVADYVYYLNKDGEICQYKVGETAAKTIVELDVDDDHGHSHDTLTISSVSGERVYYTTSADKNGSLRVATAENSDTVVLHTVPSTYFGWKDGIIYTRSESVEGTTIYHIIYVSTNDGSVREELIDPTQNGYSITLNKLEGNLLYYSTNSISYKLNLADPSAKPEAYAYSLSTTNTGWSVPDVLSFDWQKDADTKEHITYVFSLSAGSVTVVKFNPKRNNNYIEGTTSTSSSTNITLTVPEEEE